MYLNGEVEEEGEPLLKPPFRLVMLLMVLAMVCLAACLALSVDTKLLTNSLRLPVESGAASRSSDLATSGFLSILSKASSGFAPNVVDVLEGKVADLEVMKEGDERPDMEDGAMGVDDVIVKGFNLVELVRGTVDVLDICNFNYVMIK